MTFAVGDYIEFTRIVQPARSVGHRVDPETGRLVVVPEVAEQVLPQSGSGQILKLAKAPRKIKSTDRTRSGRRVERTDKYQVARVAAGPGLGTVTAILDDAILVGKQDSMELGLEDDVAGATMYGTDGKGHA